MIERIDPEKVVAVIVGVEQYGLGENENLDGAARDALKFAQWLMARGVRREKMLLYLSPLEANRQLYAGEFNLPPDAEATRDNVMHGLNERLNSDANLAGELLFLFWSGHGIAESDLERHLLFANATPNNKAAVNLDKVLKMLRTGEPKNADKKRRLFPYQVGIVDACANYGDRISLASTADVSGEPSPHVKQFILYASSVGQSAKHDDRLKAGLFSSEIQQRLDQHRPMAESRWPDFTELRDDLKQHFDRLKDENKFRFTQTPAYFQWNWPDGDNYSVGDFIDERAIRSHQQAQAVYAEVRKPDYSTEAINEAYWRTIRPRPYNAYAAQGLAEQVERLRTLGARNKQELAPLLEFAIRLNPVFEVGELMALVKTELEKTGLPHQPLADLLKKIEAEKAALVPAAKTRHLVLDVGSKQVECWHYLDDRCVDHYWLEENASSREALISEHVRKIQSDERMPEKLFLEFFIEFQEKGGEAEDGHGFDQWDHQRSHLGCFHPVVVRWRDRTLSRRAVNQNLWRQKCSLIKDRESLQQPPEICWLPDKKYPPPQRMRKLTETEDYDCVGLAVAPDGNEPEARTILLDVLESGVPFAFWPRRPPEKQAKFIREFKRDVTACCETTSKLPARLQQLRGEAAGKKHHTHSHITLLWDDAARNPANYQDDQFGLPE